MAWFLLAAPALAGERLLERGDLVLERASLSLEVNRIHLPAPVPAPPEDPADRLCRANATYLPGPSAVPGGPPTFGRVAFSPTGCHPAVEKAVADATAQWGLQLRPTPIAEQDILVAWFRFPEDPSAPVDLAISVVPGTEVMAIPAGIQVATMAHPTHRAPVLPVGKTQTLCDVVVKVDEGGVPYNFELGACPAAAASAIRDSLLEWRFSPALLGTAPTRVRVPLTVRFSDDGTAGIRLRPAADDDMRYLSDDPAAARLQAEQMLPPVPPLPEGGPLFVVRHSFYAPVEVYSLDLPPPAAAPARCSVGLQVRSDRRTYVWTEAPCDEGVREAALTAARSWLLRPSDLREKDEVFARFRVSLWWRSAGAAPIVVIDEREILSKEAPPEGVLPYTPPEPIRRVPPKQAEGRVGTCNLNVALDPTGRPVEVTAESCSQELASPAIAAVRKWRWTPATLAGERVETTTRVSVRFR